MNDTCPEMDKMVAERYKLMTPDRCMRIASSMFETARAIIESSLPPSLTRRERRLAFAKRLYAGELASLRPQMSSSVSGVAPSAGAPVSPFPPDIRDQRSLLSRATPVGLRTWMPLTPSRLQRRSIDIQASSGHVFAPWWCFALARLSVFTMYLLYDSTPAEFRSAYGIAGSVERLSAATKRSVFSA